MGIYSILSPSRMFSNARSITSRAFVLVRRTLPCHPFSRALIDVFNKKSLRSSFHVVSDFLFFHIENCISTWFCDRFEGKSHHDAFRLYATASSMHFAISSNHVVGSFVGAISPGCFNGFSFHSTSDTVSSFISFKQKPTT